MKKVGIKFNIEIEKIKKENGKEKSKLETQQELECIASLTSSRCSWPENVGQKQSKWAGNISHLAALSLLWRSVWAVLEVKVNGMVGLSWLIERSLFIYKTKEGRRDMLLRYGPFEMAPSWVGPFVVGNRLMTNLINYYKNWSLILISSLYSPLINFLLLVVL